MKQKLNMNLLPVFLCYYKRMKKQPYAYCNYTVCLYHSVFSIDYLIDKNQCTEFRLMCNCLKRNVINKGHTY